MLKKIEKIAPVEKELLKYRDLFSKPQFYHFSRYVGSIREKVQNFSYDVKPAEGGHGGADPLICKDFVDTIDKNVEPVVTPIAGRMSVAVGCVAAESLRRGGKVIELKKKKCGKCSGDV